MDEIEIYTRVTITILGLAYPILLQVIARLDEKYASSHIVELFDKEQPKKWFKISLIVSLVAIFIWSFHFKPLFQINGLNYFINNSASILVLISSTALVTAFFFYVNKIIVYYTPVKFINYLIKEHSKQSKELKHFNALTDVFLLSVQKQNQNISQTISRFFYDAFRKEREKFVGRPVEYPEAYYSLVYKTIEELAMLKNRKQSGLEYRTSGGVWLLGEQGVEVSETTYNWIWRNILLAIKYEQDDLILHHWEHAHQYITYNLDYIYPDYEENTLVIKNQEAIDKRNKERNHFFKFHYALGGLLMYKKRYACIKRIFNYTTSHPPSYELLPGSMDEIFKKYNEFRDPYESKYSWISTKYPFPEQSGINSDGVIKKWISSYFAVLLLRQYTIIPYLIIMKPLDLPELPESQGEKTEWINNLDFYKRLIVEALDNSELMESLSFQFLTKQWCVDNGKLYPVEFIEKLAELLKNKYEEDAVNLPISDDKINTFYSSTKVIIENALTKFIPLKNENIISEDYNKWFVNGQRMVQSKDAFSEKPEVHHMNYDSFLATVVSNELDGGIAYSFFLNKTKSYLLKPEELFFAVEKLGANQDYIIVAFGINLSHYIDYLKVNGLTKDNFKGIQLLSYPGTRAVNHSLFVLKKGDRPSLTTLEPEKEVVEKLALKKISEENELYASVLDLKKTSEEIRNENARDKTSDELNKSVLLSIIISTEIRWKKKIELIQLIEYSEYRQKGLPNSLSDIANIPAE